MGQNGEPFNMASWIGRCDVVLITLDTLRYDVAQAQWQAGHTPTCAGLLPSTGWERCFTPGSFTYAAHQAFFAGFLPTPARPGHHGRLFAARFAGSATTTAHTWIFDSADIVSGFAAQGYHTLCIGGVGFFNGQTALSCVLPHLFAEWHWQPHFGVTEQHSTGYQVALACERLQQIAQRCFVFLNVSAIHQPNAMYLAGQQEDTLASHGAALRYVDQQLAPLITCLRQRGPTLLIICSDHGTAYGEAGYTGHRCGHDVVWTVPFGACLLEATHTTFISAAGAIICS